MLEREMLGEGLEASICECVKGGGEDQGMCASSMLALNSEYSKH